MSYYYVVILCFSEVGMNIRGSKVRSLRLVTTSFSLDPWSLVTSFTKHNNAFTLSEIKEQHWSEDTRALLFRILNTDY